MIAALVEQARVNAALIAILAPLAGAALAALLPGGRWASLIAIVALCVSGAAAIDLAVRVLALSAPLTTAEAGVPLRMDGMGVAAGALIAGTAALVAIASAALAGASRISPIMVALFLLSVSGWLGASYAGDLGAIWLCIELGWLATCALAAVGVEEDRAALSGAFRLVVWGAVSGALTLIGAALCARALGGAGLDHIAEGRVMAQGAATLGYALMALGLAAKAGVAPLHGWSGAFHGRGLPLAVISFAACGVVAILAAISRVAAYAAINPEIGAGLSRGLLALGLVSVVIGSVQAIGARDLRRLAGYAGAAQAGCFLVAIAMGTPAGFASGIVQLGAIAASALALLSVSALMRTPVDVSALDGLGRRAPIASVTLTIGVLSLMGAPLTLGFLGRWRLIEAGVGGGWWWAAGAVIATSLAAVIYGGRLVERVYFRRATMALPSAGDPWRLALVPALIAPILAILWGVGPSRLLDAANTASRVITGWGP